MKILTADQMRRIDARAVKDYSVPGLVLMENAGRAVVEHLLEILEDPDGALVGVLCGKGNNGGDGLVAARHLHHFGATPLVFITAGPGELTGDAAAQLRMIECLPVQVEWVPDETTWRKQGGRQRLAACDVIVDALLGTGLEGAARGVHADIIADLNEAGVPVVSVDLPSGLSGSSPDLVGPAVQADATVTFVAPKIPHLFGPAEELCGDLVVAAIGVPEEAVEAEGVQLEWLDEDILEGMLPPRLPESHKGDHGHVLVVGGSVGRSGAVRLAAEAVLTAGAGLVTAAVPAPVRPEVAGYAPAMTADLPAGEHGGMAADALEVVRRLMEDADVLLVGMGAGRDPETAQVLRALVASAPLPVILDADGLNAFEGNAAALHGEDRPLVLTPHPGEMARLMGCTAAEVQADRIAACRRMAVEQSCHVVLKGDRTLVGDPGGRIWVNSTGNPALATAGSGDVLAGILAGLLAAGGSVTEALLLGVYVHGLAGDEVAEEIGERALTAELLLQALPGAMGELEECAG